ncbi:MULTISPECIES: PASTA domain-containing protein [unclassified Chryseobacterium]|uniref:PASTA domain-containing protein n=1 Tax=unclassified Chryseobacterium TaxID=2593645 RepID=UPI000913F2D8|nr:MULTISPECIES: PASTA domain-containing protein [unclassified Chryseobacterium]SHG62236.1 serine/threonine protein kinase [Chryseobacterium sp. OV279]HCA07990.1 PASTA domain-containing protein [Chryseobacterium sp.]
MLKSLFNWKVLLNLVVAIGVFVGLVWLTFRWLEYHTKHGQEIPVPNVINKSVYDAVKILEDTGLEYEVDSAEYNPKYKPFQVLKMHPLSSSRVKPGSLVRIVVNPRTWAPITVPDVINKYSGLAFQRLDQVGLKIGDTIYEPSIQKDALLRVLYKGNAVNPGSRLPRFSVIDVVVGSGPMRNISIPSVVGLSVKEARAVILKSMFEIGLVEHEDGSKDESDIIYYQDPASGDVRDQGMQIDLWASKRTPAELRAKVEQLNAIYRMKVDTSLPPVHYDEVPNHPEPSYDPPAAVPVPRKEVPKVEPAKTEPAKTSVTTGAKPAGTTAEKPKSTASSSQGSGNKPAATGTTQQPAQKPKAKKVVVE